MHSWRIGRKRTELRGTRGKTKTSNIEGAERGCVGAKGPPRKLSRQQSREFWGAAAGLRHRRVP